MEKVRKFLRDIEEGKYENKQVKANKIGLDHEELRTGSRKPSFNGSRGMGESVMYRRFIAVSQCDNVLC